MSVISNYVFVSFLCQTGQEAENYTQFSLIKNVTGYTTNDPEILVSQYNAEDFNIYAYSNENQNIQFNYLSNNITTKLSDVELIKNTVTPLSFQYTPKSTNSGQKLQFYADQNNQVSFLLNVQSIGTSITEVTGYSLLLNSSSKTQGDATWSYENYNTEFTGFDWYGNGWINKALVINNDARAIVPYTPFSTNEFTISFKVQAPNGVYYTLDENNNKIYEPLIYCNSGNTGFYIYSEKAEFFNYGVGISTEFNSDEPHEITFVRHGSDYNYIMEIFVDGVSQCSAQASSNNIVLHDNPIVMTAKHVQLYVYNIIAFTRGLPFSDIQSIYCFNKDNSTDIINYINKNNVFDGEIELGNNINKVTIASLPIGSCYMVITSFGEDDAEPWNIINGYDGKDADSTKSIRHAVGSVKFIQKTEEGRSPRNFCVDRATLSAQGTSSMSYPIKNFRFYFKKTINSSCAYYNSVETHTDGKAGDFCYSNVIYTNIQEDFTITPSTTTLEYTTNKENDSDMASSSKVKYSMFNKKFGNITHR